MSKWLWVLTGVVLLASYIGVVWFVLFIVWNLNGT